MAGTFAAPASPLLTLSQSSLQDYVDCARRFELRYLQDLVWPAVDAEPLEEVEQRQQEALLFHRLVQQHYLGVPSDAIAAMATSADLARWWSTFTSAQPDLAGWSLFTEKGLAASVRLHRLVCKYDLVAVKDHKAVIYDWKTFRRRPAEETLAARMQTKIYCSMLLKAGAEINGGTPFAPMDISMVYWFAEYPREPAVFAYSEQQYASDWRSLEALVDEIDSREAFPLTEDLRQCRFCNYRSLCDRGRTPGTDSEFEALTLREREAPEVQAAGEDRDV